MNKYFKLAGLVILIVLLGWWVKSIGEPMEDFRIMSIDDDGVMLRSVSWQRKMINSVKVAPETKVWVPKGMSWYPSSKIKKLLISQRSESRAGDVAFYNFGFIPDVVIWGNVDWIYNRAIISKWGVLNYIRFLISYSGMMAKEEVVDSDLTKSVDYLNDMVQRDLADSNLLNDDLRLTVYNQGGSNGLAGFMSRVLEWSGFTVVGIENSGGNTDMCQIHYGTGVGNDYGLKILRKQFPECVYKQTEELMEREVELYFGDKFSQMLNYQSYNPGLSD